MLVVWPPEVPVSANCYTYHYIDFIAPISYLCHLGYDVDSINMGLLNQHKQELYLKITELPKKIAIFCDFHMVQAAIETVMLVRLLSPLSEVLIYGPITSVYAKDILEFDKRLLIGGFGDYETILESYFLNDYKGRVVSGYWLDGERFQPINLKMFNPYDYHRLIDLDRNRSQGIFVGLEISRGCANSCSYCRSTLEKNKTDRRASISNLVSFISQAKDMYGFDCFKFISPDFAQNKKWVTEFLDAIKGMGVIWKCCTRIEYFEDESFVKLFKEAGCVSVSVGLESNNVAALSKLGRLNSNIYKGINNLLEQKINIKGMVMLGIPGSDFESTKEWIETLEKIGVAVRPTMYTDYKKIQFGNLHFADKRLCVHNEHTVTMVEMCLDRNGKMY